MSSPRFLWLGNIGDIPFSWQERVPLVGNCTRHNLEAGWGGTGGQDICSKQNLWGTVLKVPVAQSCRTVAKQQGMLRPEAFGSWEIVLEGDGLSLVFSDSKSLRGSFVWVSGQPSFPSEWTITGLFILCLSQLPSIPDTWQLGCQTDLLN